MGQLLRSAVLLFAIAALPTACSGNDESDTGDVPKRALDSAIGASGLPGASGITRAMGAADSAAARARLHDSLADAR
jgi:hypothetical protein